MPPDNKRRLALLAALGLTALGVPHARAATRITVHKDANCGCCSAWVKHITDAGFEVSALDVIDLPTIKKQYGVPAKLESCHTALVEDYVIEGHVPARDIRRLLAQRPKARGLAVPGMPVGSPGMEGKTTEPYQVMLFDAEGKTSVFARYG
jgi:hypothetical protein